MKWRPKSGASLHWWIRKTIRISNEDLKERERERQREREREREVQMLDRTVSRQRMYSFPLCSLDIYCIFNEFKLRQKMKCNAICVGSVCVPAVSFCPRFALSFCHCIVPSRSLTLIAFADFLFAASNWFVCNLDPNSMRMHRKACWEISSIVCLCVCVARQSW